MRSAFMVVGDWLSKANFLECLNEVELSSSPGVPLLFVSPTNRGLLKNPDGTWRQDRVELLWQLVQNRIYGKQHADLIRVFIKEEPHTQEKLSQERYRLIYSVSLVDSLVDRMLFGSLASNIYSLYASVPSMVGWSPLYGGWRFINPNLWGYDKSAWEYSFSGYMAEDCFSILSSLVEADDMWHSVARRRFHELFVDVNLVTSSGIVVKQDLPGVMKSGSFLTILVNSLAQLYLDALASFEVGEDPDPDILIMGDDTIQNLMSDAKRRAIESFGVKLKDPIKGEFCGMIFNEDTSVEPVHVGKHLVRMLYTDPDDLEDLFRSYQLLYCKSKNFCRMKDIIRSVCPEAVVPPKWLFGIYDGPN
uniref:RNA-dependent RNA polymerase n=1 Tax=Xi'an sobemo-like virus TaxID=2789628 RepID=A0A7T1LYN6_9VIRU|nr:RNA-dependent RNA polymerase [Xi'an sobemo-like virus]